MTAQKLGEVRGVEAIGNKRPSKTQLQTRYGEKIDQSAFLTENDDTYKTWDMVISQDRVEELRCASSEVERKEILV